MGNLGCAMNVNNHGWTEVMYGTLAPFSDSVFGTLVQGRAAINIDGHKIDLGTLGGPNSWMNWGQINERRATLSRLHCRWCGNSFVGLSEGA